MSEESEDKFLKKKTKRAENNNNIEKSSSGSDNIIFSDDKNETYSIKHVNDFQSFLEYFNQIKNPCYTIDVNYLKEQKFSEKLNNPNCLDIALNFVTPIETIKKSDIIPIKDPKYFFIKEKKLANYFIFSNIFSEEEDKKEKKIFNNTHTFSNGYYYWCDIDKFCPDKDLHFPNNKDNVFYPIERNSLKVRSIKCFHYQDYGIAYFFSPKGTGKSILFRSILINFADFNDERRYTPIIIFNIKLMAELLNSSNINQLKKVVLHESYSLFKKKEDCEKFIEKINFSSNSVMELIYNIIINANENVKDNKNNVFILDGFSSIYDKNKILANLIDLVIEKKNFFLEIIYDIKNTKDSEKLYLSISPEIPVNSVFTNINKYFYFEELKTFSEIKKYLEDDEIQTIPKTYEKYFGENVSYYFEYKSKEGKLFEDFVNEKKSEIKNDILEFYNSYNYDLFSYLTKIEDLIIKKKEFTYNDDIKYIPGNYIKIIIEPKQEYDDVGLEYYNKQKYYKLDYCFPLVKTIIKEIIIKERIINMKHPNFLKLPPQALGINFDINMNEIILQSIKDEAPFFGHKNKTYLFVEDILEKLGNDKVQIYKKEDVISTLEKMNDIKNLKNNLDKINYNEYSLIGIFQEDFNGKAFDLLIILKENEEEDFIMDLIQIKCSDTYSPKEDEIIYQVKYVKVKFEYLLNIKIGKTYLSYLSIYQLPKKYASDNQEKSFLYDIYLDKYVDFEGNEYKKFPILNGAIIYDEEEYDILIDLQKELIKNHNKSFKLI